MPSAAFRRLKKPSALTSKTRSNSLASFSDSFRLISMPPA